MTLGAASILTALAAAAFQPPQDELPVQPEEFVVTGDRRRALEPLLEPIAYFRRHCFDALRLQGRTAPPADDDGDWQVLPDGLRQRLRIDETSPAFMLSDPQRGHALVLRFERPGRDDGLNETRCTLMVIGGNSQADLGKGLTSLFRGSGTDRHVGHPEGVPRLPGWQQRIWIAIPQRRSTRWQAYPAHRGGGGFVRVADPIFYDKSDYIMGDLKQSVGRSPPVSIVTLSYTTMGERRAK